MKKEFLAENWFKIAFLFLLLFLFLPMRQAYVSHNLCLEGWMGKQNMNDPEMARRFYAQC